MSEHLGSCACKLCNPDGKGDPDAALAAMRSALANPQTPTADDVWMPLLSPAERHQRFARDFTDEQVSSLRSFGCTEVQVSRLRTLLSVIAAEDQPPPKLADVRAHLNKLAGRAREANNALRSIFNAPESEMGRHEAMVRILGAISSLYPERCQIDPKKVSLFNEYDELMAEAERLLTALSDVEAIAKHAIKGMPPSATKARALPHPIGRIHEALRHDWIQTPRQQREPIPPSVSITSPFRKIIGVCYTAAGASTKDPVRAIRAYMKALHNSSGNPPRNRARKKK